MPTQLVKALRPHRYANQLRTAGEVYAMGCGDVRRMVRAGVVALMGQAPDWYARAGRDLRLWDGTQPGRIIACLNIWNDAPALRGTLPSWMTQVAAIVVADGPYAMTGQRGASTDDLRLVLGMAPCPKLYLDLPTSGVWPDQATKRTALLQAAAAAYPDDTLFIVDADETLTGSLHPLLALDVGWLTIRNPTLYARRYDQPRLIRARPDLRYDLRHHWLYAADALLATHQYGGVGVLHRLVPAELTNHRNAGQSLERQRIKHRYLQLQHADERTATTGAVASDASTGRRESLRVLQLTALDPAFVAGRLHTAINATTPHVSLLGSDRDNNPYRAPMQYAMQQDRGMLAMAWEEADVIHWHLNYQTLEDMGRSWRDKPWRVIHHHGTMLRQRAAYYNVVDQTHAGLRLVSNLELLQYGEGLRWLPNPMPTAEYRRLRAGYQRGPTFRVAHSPSKRHLKGTEALLAAVDSLQARGLAIEAVLIEGQSYADSVRIKAGCDAVFDSFWLGIQCSGLEGAAMGLPVVAGDPMVADLYREVVGQVPYTFANDEGALAAALEQLATDAGFYVTEAQRVARYCEEYHDSAAVALRYLDLLDDAFQWRSAMRAGRIRPEPLTPETRPVKSPRGPRVVVPIPEPPTVSA